jgi:hypothetical protein
MILAGVLLKLGGYGLLRVLFRFGFRFGVVWVSLSLVGGLFVSWSWVINAGPRPLNPQEDRPDTRCTRDWKGPRVGLDGSRKSRPHRDSNPGSSGP